MPLKILTIDDSKTIRLIIVKAFRAFDCEVIEAANGMEGLAIAAREKPQIILLDLTMPVMDGYETLTRFKADPELKSIPIVMLTAESGRENVLRIAKQGVRDYLVKPFKEELVVERIGRIVELKPRVAAPVRPRKFDDPLSILVVDDKPAIADQIRAGLADTPWVVHGKPDAPQAIEHCTDSAPDVILVSLSLAGDAGFTLLRAIRSTPRLKSIPVFAMCVKTITEDQVRAQHSGFTGVVTKPIDVEDVKARIVRCLSLDTSYKYFQNRDGVMIVTLPATFGPGVANDVTSHLRRMVADGVNAGIDRLILDISALKSADLSLIKLGLEVMNVCQEMSLRLRMVGSAAVAEECRIYEETKDWTFFSSIQESIDGTDGKPVSTQ
jgi:two-component system cell cycle response regulator